MLNKLRLNLTLLNTVVLIVILTIISIFVYVLMYYNLYAGIDETLTTSTHQIESYVSFLEESAHTKEVDVEKQNEHLRALHNMIKNNISYVVWDSEKNVYSSYRELDDDILLSIRRQVINDSDHSEKLVSDLNRNFYFQTISIDGVNYRICTTYFPTDTEENNIRTIQMIKNLRTEKEVLGRLAFTLLATILIGATLSIIGGYILAGRSLIPVIKSWKRQQEFVADASHELRTPLAVVQANLEVVKGSPEETVESQRYWINNAYDETLRMNKMIQDLLFLARVDSGQNELERQEVDLTFLLHDVNEKLMPLAVNQGMQIFGDIEENLMIQGDPNKIRQLMVILIDNAIKYSKSQTKIIVKGKSLNKHGILIEVIDHGIGMEEEDADRVFDRFYRSDKVRSREQGGTGLGLSIAKWIVDMHKGEISIESKPKEGTTVIVQLPCN